MMIECLLAAALLAGTPGERHFADLPATANPLTIGEKMSEMFLEQTPDRYGPKGMKRPMKSPFVSYTIVSLWVNALEFAHTTANAELKRRLVAAWEPFRDGGALASHRSPPYHVDFTVFGAVPYEIYLMSGDKDALRLGNHYAETQWRYPTDEETHQLPKYCWDGVEQHILPRPELEKYVAMGLSHQTRLWIDDMYMITVLQTQAYRATKDPKYLTRAVKEALLYVDKLQIKEGPLAGLFYHAPDVPFVWGRGAGWMAAGMPLILQYMDPATPDYARMLTSYRLMMKALLKYQRANGLWGQLVDDPKIWDETSGSAMFAYGFIEGLRHGWLDAAEYGPAARKAWLALCGMLDENCNLREVCIGTGKKNDRQHYYDRPRVDGYPHGQAAMLWCINALISK